MTRSSILLVGSGQLGSRYLQGIMPVRSSLDITVIEPSPESVERTQRRLNEITTSYSHQVMFMPTLENLSEKYDLAIISTTAKSRFKIIRDVLRNCHINHWVIEKVLAQSSQELDSIANLIPLEMRAWVNTPRRLMKWHQEICNALRLENPSPIHVTVEGGSWGLACNSIHFIDMVSWWINGTVTNIDSSDIKLWKQSKRAGFYECYGTVIVEYDDKSSLKLICSEDSQKLIFKIETPNGTWNIDESEGKAYSPDGTLYKGEIALQSQLTSGLVNNIVNTGQCSLPTLHQSISQHRPLLSSLLDSWNKLNMTMDSIVPIT